MFYIKIRFETIIETEGKKEERQPRRTNSVLISFFYEWMCELMMNIAKAKLKHRSNEKIC